MDEELIAVEVSRKTGAERFRRGGHDTPHNLLEFWRWSGSDLVSNAMRGILAEYIVGLALGCAAGTRREWDAADLVTHDGVRVEVKSAAHLQTWAQQRPSRISFGIQPTFGWDAASNIVSVERRRQADLYVFALLDHRSKATIDPLDLDQWVFHVLATARLAQAVPMQRTIGLTRLLSLGPETVAFDGLASAVSLAAGGGASG